MVPVNRREFVAASGIAVSAIAGCLAREGDDESEVDGGSGNDSLPEDVTTVLDPIPASVEGLSLQYVQLIDPEAYSQGSRGTAAAFLSPDLGLDASQVDRVAMATYGDQLRMVKTIVGSFGADDVSDGGYGSVSASDGLVLQASGGQSGWEAGLDAATAARDDPDAGVDATAPLAVLFGPVTRHPQAMGMFDLDGGVVSVGTEIDTDAVEAVASGMTADIETREQTLTLVVVFAEGASVDASVVREIVGTGDVDADPGNLEVTTGDRRATTTVTQELPHSRLPDNSPDVHFGIDYDVSDETATIRHRAGDAVDASNLEVRVDGERVDAPWQPDETIEAGDTYEVGAPPASLVRVVWVDPTLDDVVQPLASEIVGLSGAFDGSYDSDADEITVTYTGEQPLDADRFVLQREHETGDNTYRESERPLAEYVESLQQGNSFVVSDAQYGDGVELRYEPERETSLPAERVFRYDVRAPGSFQLEREGGEPSLVYHGQRPVPATNFRVLVDGQRSERQWTDVTDTLAGDERLAVDAAPGATIVVEYVDAEDPRQVFEQTVLPDADFTFDIGDSTVEITHTGGTPVSASELVAYVAPAASPRRTEAFSNEFETVSAGDSITIEYEVPDGEDVDRAQAVTVLYEGDVLDYADHSYAGGNTGGGSSGDGRSSAGSSGGAESASAAEGS